MGLGHVGGVMNTIFDNMMARAGLEAIASNGGPSARVCRAIIAHADEAWDGRVDCALDDVRDGEVPTRTYILAGTDAARVAAFVARMPPTFGHRTATPEEIAASRAAMDAARAKADAEEAAAARRRAAARPDTGGNYRPSTGDAVADARNWAAASYAAGDSISDD